MRSSADTRTLRFPMLKLFNALFHTVLQSNGILSLLTSVTISPHLPSKLRLKPTSTKLPQVISDSVFLLAFHPFPSLLCHIPWGGGGAKNTIL